MTETDFIISWETNSKIIHFEKIGKKEFLYWYRIWHRRRWYQNHWQVFEPGHWTEISEWIKKSEPIKEGDLDGIENSDKAVNASTDTISYLSLPASPKCSKDRIIYALMIVYLRPDDRIVSVFYVENQSFCG